MSIPVLTGEIFDRLKAELGLSEEKLAAQGRSEQGQPLTRHQLYDARERITKHSLAFFRLFDRLCALHGINDEATETRMEALAKELQVQRTLRLTEGFLTKRVRDAERIYIANTYVPYADKVADSIRRSAAGLSNIRILLMAPDSRYLQARARDLGLTIRSMHQRIKQSLEAFEQAGLASCVRLYHDPPAVPIYALDDDVYAGFYLKGVEAVDSPQRRFSASEDAGRAILEHYENIWSDRSTERDFDTAQLRPPVPERVLAMLDLFSASRGILAPDTYANGMEPIVGIYEYARYRVESAAPNRQEKPIVTGLIAFLPYDEVEGVAEFEDHIPAFDFLKTHITKRYAGVILPYNDFFFLVGDEKADGYPLMVGVQKPNPETQMDLNITLRATILRRHPNGPLFAARMVFRRLGRPKFGLAGSDYRREMELMLKAREAQDPFLTDQQFHDRFELGETVEESLLAIQNSPNSTDPSHSVLETIRHSSIGGATQIPPYDEN